MTLTPRMNIWTEDLLAYSIVGLALILPFIVTDVYRDLNLTNAIITKASILAIIIFGMFVWSNPLYPGHFL